MPFKMIYNMSTFDLFCDLHLTKWRVLLSAVETDPLIGRGWEIDDCEWTWRLHIV